MDGRLRPLGIGEMLDAAIKIFTRHWRPLALSVIGLVLPVQILAVLVTASIAPESLDLTTSETGVSRDEETEFLLSQLAIGLLSFLSVLLATATCFKAVADAYLGVEPDWRRSLKFAARRLFGLVGLAVLGFLAVGIATLLLILPGIWLFVMYAVAVPALLLERIGPVAALRRSFRLVKGRWWATFGVLLVGYMLASIVGAIVQSVITLVPSLVADGNTAALAFGSAVGGTVGAVITTPYSAAVVALLYFDLRVRKEGLDLQLLADDAGVRRDPDAPLPGPLQADEWTPEERAQAPYWPPPPGWRPSPPPGASEPPPPWSEPHRPSPVPPPAASEPSAPGRWLPPQPGGPPEP